MADLPRGRALRPRRHRRRRRTRLNRLGVFRSLRFVEAEEIAAGRQPADRPSRVEDRRPRTIGFGGTLSTIDGVGVTAYWLHRNLFGRAEQLRFDASVDGLGGSLNPDDYDYNLGVTFTKPGVFNPDTNFVTSLIGQRVDYDTYRERSVTAHGRLHRSLRRATSPASVFAHGLARRATRTTSASGTSPLLGLVGAAAYDRRDDPLDATRGYYLAATAQPVLRVRVRQPALRRHARGARLQGLRRAGPPRPRRPRQGRQLRRPGHRPRARPTCCSSPAAAARSAATPIARSASSTIGRARRGAASWSAARGSSKARARCATGSTTAWAAVGFVDAGFVTENVEPSAARATFGPASGSACATTPASACCASTSRRRCNPRSGDSRIALYIGIGQAF